MTELSLGPIEELSKHVVQCITEQDQQFVLIFQQDEFSLLDNLCPHKAAALCDGELFGDQIECPWHKARFDIRTGRGLSPLAGHGVKSWPLTIRDGQLIAQLA